MVFHRRLAEALLSVLIKDCPTPHSTCAQQGESLHGCKDNRDGVWEGGGKVEGKTEDDAQKWLAGEVIDKWGGRAQCGRARHCRLTATHHWARFSFLPLSNFPPPSLSLFHSCTLHFWLGTLVRCGYNELNLRKKKIVSCVHHFVQQQNLFKNVKFLTISQLFTKKY